MLLEEADKGSTAGRVCAFFGRRSAGTGCSRARTFWSSLQAAGLAEWLDTKLKERGEAANARDHLFVDAGTIVPGFSLARWRWEWSSSVTRLSSSIATKATSIRTEQPWYSTCRFRAGGAHFDYLAVGDGHVGSSRRYRQQRTRYHKNDDRLAWDL